MRELVRILLLHNRYREPGGEDAVVAAEAGLLRAAGHEVVEHVTANPTATRESAIALARAPWNTSAARECAAVIRSHQPDVVHIHNTWFSQSPAVVATAARNAPVVMTLHNYRLLCANSLLYRDGGPCQLCVGSHPWHGVVHRCYRRSAAASVPAAATIAWNRWRSTYDDVAAFVALTEFGRQRFVAGGVPAERIRVKPHFVPDPGPRPAPASDSDEVLYVGRLSPEKGVHIALQAWLGAAVPGLRLTIVGEGPQQAALRRLNVPGVSFAGRMAPAQLRNRMLRARALLVPSQWYEPFGLVAIEAMAAGMPVAVSDIGGLPDIVGDSGWPVPAGDHRAWVRALERLADSSQIDQRGAVARETWATRFSPAVALPALERLYAAALQRP
jgi:glycosyltransferase involved in cell wall biosynthesis